MGLVMIEIPLHQGKQPVGHCVRLESVASLPHRREEVFACVTANRLPPVIALDDGVVVTPIPGVFSPIADGQMELAFYPPLPFDVELQIVPVT
jgi:hypothetical protein